VLLGCRWSRVGQDFAAAALAERSAGCGGLTGACGKAQDGTQACGRLPMHAQKQSNKGRLARGLRGEGAGQQELGPRQRELLELLSEQGAVPFDQLVRFLGCKRSRVKDSIRSLERRGWIEQQRFLAGDSRWFWLSRKGVGVADRAHRYTVPNVRSLPHRRAINETRLFLRDRAPAGCWSSERAIHGVAGSAEHVPDAVFEVGGERHAIEVELSRKPPREVAEILDQHSLHYDAVIYFCGPQTYRLMQRVQAEGRWPKLMVKQLSGRGSSC
jgi:DNA-binding MarR family transcriptional regulator